MKSKKVFVFAISKCVSLRGSEYWLRYGTTRFIYILHAMAYTKDCEQVFVLEKKLIKIVLMENGILVYAWRLGCPKRH